VCALHETHGFPRIQAVDMPRLRGAAPAVRCYCTPADSGVNTPPLDLPRPLKVSYSSHASFAALRRHVACEMEMRNRTLNRTE
jgi:hypothetical protein